jgi:uncharacterized protein (TIGR02145 family)
MNRVLFKAAAIVNIAAAALIYVACSGDDGKDGTPGAGCVGTPSAAVAGGIDITCGGIPAGTLQPGTPGTPGAPGDPGVQGPPGGVGSADGCYLQPSTAGGYDAICGGQNMGPLVTGGPGGGCSVNPGSTGDPYYIFTCPGGATYEVAKAICGTIAYDPARYACDFTDVIAGTGGPKIDSTKCGSTVISKPLEQFCQNAATGTVKLFCGRQAVVDSIQRIDPSADVSEVTGKTYTASQFCQVAASGTYGIENIFNASTNADPDTVRTADQANSGTIKSKCGPQNLVYGPHRFCYENSALNVKCGTPLTGTVSGTLLGNVAKGAEFGANEMCVDGTTVSGSCSGIPFTVATEFCQGGTSAKLLCSRDAVVDSAQRAGVSDPAILANLKGKQYSATQFCQAAGTGVGIAVASTAAAGKIKNLCVLTANSTAQPYPAEQFCQPNGQATGTIAVLKPLCGDSLRNGNPFAVTLNEAKEYPVTKFCQGTAGTGVTGADGEPTTVQEQLLGQIKDKCGTSRFIFGTGYYCSISGAVAPKVNCGTTPFDDETHFCVTNTDVYPTCKPRRAASQNVYGTATDLYDPDEKVCETRGNILYSYEALGGNDWITENAKPNNVNTFTWTAAQTACPDGWELPDDAAWDGLITAANPGSAGINLRAKSGWTTNSTSDAFSKFAAIPAGATGLNPAPTGNYAYWWTSDEGGFQLDQQGQITGTPNSPKNYNLGHYKYIAEQSTAVGWGHSAKLTTSLSVRCIKSAPASCDASHLGLCQSSGDCTGAGGSWRYNAGECALNLTTGAKVEGDNADDCTGKITPVNTALAALQGVTAVLEVGTFATDNCPLTLATGAKITTSGSANTCNVTAVNSATAVTDVTAVVTAGTWTGTGQEQCYSN